MPLFFYTGGMKPFNPKEYKKYMVMFNLFKKDCSRVVFPGTVKVNNQSRLLAGDYTDWRRLSMFYSMDDVKLKEKVMKKVIKNWTKILDK